MKVEEIRRASGYVCDECQTFITEHDEGGPVYECSRCGGTQVEERRCEQCNIFMAKLADTSCPECEAPFEDPEEAEGWCTPDGEFFELEEHAVEWVEGAPEREEVAAQKREETQRWLEQVIAEREEECRAFNTKFVPRARELLRVLDESRTPRFVDALRWNLENIEGDDAYPITTLVVDTQDVARLVGVPEEEIEFQLDFDAPVPERMEQRKRIGERIRGAMPLDLLSEESHLRWWFREADMGSAIHAEAEEALILFEHLVAR